MPLRCRRLALVGVGLALWLVTGTTGTQAQVQVPSTATATSEAGSRASYAAAPCPSPNVPGVPQLELGDDFSCGYLTVPENRAHPDGRQIRIAVARARSASPDPEPDPILYLAGGPGGTGLATAVQRVQEGWNRDRDVIFVDQRGTLHADPLLSCPEVDTFLRQAVSLVPTDPDTGAQDVAAVRACHDRLASEGYELSDYNTTENAADIADLRVALGVPEWNVYGVSYGSDLALQLLRDHPQGIRSVVLDSLAPPNRNLIDDFWPNAASGYEAVIQACAAQAACNTAYPNLQADLTTAITRLNEHNVTADVLDAASGQRVRVVFDGYQAANLLVVLSLYPGSYAAMPSIIHQLATGDVSQAGAALLATVPPVGLTGYGLTYGVFCREQAAFTTPARAITIARQALPNFPEPVLGLSPQIARVFDECAAWDVGRADPAVAQQTRSDVPALLLGGTFDAITPPSSAAVAAMGLTNSRVVRVPGVGHDVTLWSDCGRSIMLSFLDQPMGDYDTGCLEDLTPPAFATGG